MVRIVVATSLLGIMAGIFFWVALPSRAELRAMVASPMTRESILLLVIWTVALGLVFSILTIIH